MKNINKTFIILLALVLMVSMLAGCGAKGDSTDKKVIGVLIADFSDQFQVHVMEQMKAEAAKYPDLEVLYQDGKYDAQMQISQAENLIVKQVDAIVLFQVDDNSAMTIAKAVKEADIPLIAVNRSIPDHSYLVSYVGSDDVEAGEIQAKQLVEELGGKGNIFILNGTLGTEPQRDRRQGYDNILKDYPEIKIIGEHTGDWARDKGMKIMEDVLQSDDEINGVLSNNDEMAMGAVKAIQDFGKTNEIVISGIDGTPEALEYILKDELTFTVYQDAFGQGAGAIEAAYKTINGEEVEKEIIIPFQLVTKDSAADFLAKFNK